jgi:uncharacterized protein YoaH (UPF0181 family)
MYTLYSECYKLATAQGQKKDEKVANLMAAGMSKSNAEYFYKLANKAAGK